MQTSYILIGVSGCGKSTVGKLLADRLEFPFFDGDDYHPQSNKDKMASGTPLTDEDRMPWLDTLAQLVSIEKPPCVIACSALKKSYRDRLKTSSVQFIFLKGDQPTLLSRLQNRSNTTDHFMPASLLESQLATLESPEQESQVISIDITHPTETIVDLILNTQT